MTRPAFALADDEARALILNLQAINERYPLNQRDHRPFVRAFIRAVYEATGKTFSPAIYRRLLGAYAPERRPSTATLALEKEALVDELARERDGAVELGQTEAPQLAALIRTAVLEAVGDWRPVQSPYPGAGGGGDSTYWRERVTELERSLADTQAHAARLAGELQAARASVEQMGAELTGSRAALTAQSVEMAKLADAIESSRLFFMRAIDDARGETRVWRERCAKVEAQAAAKAREDQILLETFRQMAYQRGGAIPAALRKVST
jgi:hypothetical protein